MCSSYFSSVFTSVFHNLARLSEIASSMGTNLLIIELKLDLLSYLLSSTIIYAKPTKMKQDAATNNRYLIDELVKTPWKAFLSELILVNRTEND